MDRAALISLGGRAARGCHNAVDALVRHYQKDLTETANAAAGRFGEPGEFTGVAVMHFMRRLRTFDPGRGCVPWTWCAFGMKGEIKRLVWRQSGCIDKPRRQATMTQSTLDKMDVARYARSIHDRFDDGGSYVYEPWVNGEERHALEDSQWLWTRVRSLPDSTLRNVVLVVLRCGSATLAARQLHKSPAYVKSKVDKAVAILRDMAERDKLSTTGGGD